MNALSFFRELYSLDTLDTRFTTSSSTPLKAAADGSPKPAERDGKTQPAAPTKSRWGTPEFYLYTVVFLVCVPQMYWAVVQVSQFDSPNFQKYEHLLSPGWLFGRKVDNSDQQYAAFRDNVPMLSILLFVHPLLRKVYDRLTLPTPTAASGPSNTKAPGGSTAPELRLRNRLAYDFVFALIYIVALHGFSALKVLFILYLNYSIAHSLPKPYIPPATWAFNIVTLFANELAQGYRFTSIAGFVTPFYPGAAEVGKFLDSYGGLNPRWEVLFNLTVLRLISFNMDYYWSLDRSRSASPVEKKQLDPANLSERDRVSIPAPVSLFTSFRTYFAYVLYPPLYLTGPILTFNDYINQCTYQSPSITTRRTFLYGVRFLAAIFCMEFLLHTIYVVAISKCNPDWNLYTPFQLSMLAYFNLHIVWLKLLIPWRFFRLWALIDGIDPPENMVRCMSDNYSALAFWRAWHRSYNRWIVRYIYVPLGGGIGGGTGRVRGIANMLGVFTFVALWHDINLRLLMWGWLVVLFVLPEVLATLAFPAKKWKDRPEAYRMLCGVGAVGNILMMMAANLVGFAVGLDGLMSIVNGVVGSWSGWAFLAIACGALFVGVQVMFEHREEEKRKGIRMKC